MTGWLNLAELLRSIYPPPENCLQTSVPSNLPSWGRVSYICTLTCLLGSLKCFDFFVQERPIFCLEKFQTFFQATAYNFVKELLFRFLVTGGGKCSLFSLWPSLPSVPTDLS